MLLVFAVLLATVVGASNADRCNTTGPLPNCLAHNSQGIALIQKKSTNEKTIQSQFKDDGDKKAVLDREQLLIIFRLLDSNQDGKLSLLEAGQLNSDLPSEESLPSEDLWDMADANDDEFVDFGEFSELVAKDGSMLHKLKTISMLHERSRLNSSNDRTLEQSVMGKEKLTCDSRRRRRDAFGININGFTSDRPSKGYPVDHCWYQENHNQQMERSV